MGNELERDFGEMCLDFLEGVAPAENATRTLRDLNDLYEKSSGSERVQLQEELSGLYLGPLLSGITEAGLFFD